MTKPRQGPRSDAKRVRHNHFGPTMKSNDRCANPIVNACVRLFGRRCTPMTAREGFRGTPGPWPSAVAAQTVDGRRPRPTHDTATSSAGTKSHDEDHSNASSIAADTAGFVPRRSDEGPARPTALIFWVEAARTGASEAGADDERPAVHSSNVGRMINRRGFSPE